MGPAIAGTLLITLAATVMAVPLGILAAVYITEYGQGSKLAGAIRFLSDVMAGVPSIVMGLFIYTIWVLSFGQSAFAGALALGALMLPIVIRSTESMLRLVPNSLREGSAALGASKSRMIMTVVLPAALPGITSGSLLAVARAAGETAPLLFTIGAARSVNLDMFAGSNAALSTQIFANAQQPFLGAQDRAWGAALTLIVLVLVLTDRRPRHLPAVHPALNLGMLWAMAGGTGDRIRALAVAVVLMFGLGAVTAGVPVGDEPSAGIEQDRGRPASPWPWASPAPPRPRLARRRRPPAPVRPPAPRPGRVGLRPPGPGQPVRGPDPRRRRRRPVPLRRLRGRRRRPGP